MKRIIDSKVYDNMIKTQGIQYQIVRYYQPEEISMMRRVNIVLKEFKGNKNKGTLPIFLLTIDPY